MKKILFVFSVAVLLEVLLISWFSRAGSETTAGPGDSALLAKGETVFIQNCSGCHNFRQDGIGPQLGGLTKTVSLKWIETFIRNPQKMITSGDRRAQQLYKKFKVVMPSFATLKQNEMKGLLSYLSVQKQAVQRTTVGMGTQLVNPIPEAIKMSNLVCGLQLLTTIPASSDSGKLPLTRISKLDHIPGKKDLFVLDLRGKLYKLQGNEPVLYMDMAKLKPDFKPTPGLATGFGSFAFHPEFTKNGLLYTTHTEPARTAKADFSYADSIKVALQWVLTEWKVADPAANTFAGVGRELLRVDMVSAIHGVQEITFNPLSKPGDDDYGLLYIGVGEGGAVENGFPPLAHNLKTVYGTLLRIDPAGNNSTNKRYGIPKNNPFVKDAHTEVLREIYAYGFRNPHRISWSASGEMLVGNVGHGNIESVMLVKAGDDYGWPIREGTVAVDPYGDLNKVYALPADDSIYKVTYPVIEYDHDEGKAMSGGFEYTGSMVPGLKGKYLFGDIPSGRLFYVEMADLRRGKQAVVKEWRMTVNGKATSFTDIIGKGRIDLHFGKDADGELYLMTKADGKVYKLVSAGFETAAIR